MNLTSQIILLAFLFFILLIIIGLSIKWFCYFKKKQDPQQYINTNRNYRVFTINTMEARGENNVVTVRQENIVEQLLNFQIQLHNQYCRLEFNNEKIIYSFSNQQNQIVYEYKIDQNYNQEFSKYRKNHDTIQNLGVNYKQIYDQNEDLRNYFYNTKITNEQGHISYLDAFVNYLNFQSLKLQNQTQRNNKLILFAPSTIFKIEDQQFNFETVRNNFEQFFFYFHEIDYGIEQICSSVFFAVQKLHSNQYILLQVQFQEPKEIIIHEQDQGQQHQQQQHDDYTSYVDIAPSICQECRVNQSENLICIGNEALQKSIIGQISLEEIQIEQGFNLSFEQFQEKINQRININ